MCARTPAIDMEKSDNPTISFTQQNNPLISISLSLATQNYFILVEAIDYSVCIVVVLIINTSSQRFPRNRRSPESRTTAWDNKNNACQQRLPPPPPSSPLPRPLDRMTHFSFESLRGACRFLFRAKVTGKEICRPLNY